MRKIYHLVIPILFFVFAILCAGRASAQLTYNSAFSLGLNITDQGYSIAADAQGNYYITGFHGYWMDANPLGTPFYIYNNGGQDFYVAKYNPSGIMQWAFSLGGIEDDAALKIILDAGNNVYMTGRFKDTVDFDPGTGIASRISHGNFDIFLAKYDNNGNFQWANTIGDSLSDQAFDVAVDGTTNNVIITGVYSSHHMDMDPGSGTHYIINNGNAAFNTGNCFVAAYSQSTGAYQWAFNIGGFGGAGGNRLAVDITGNVYVGGTVSGDSTDFDPGAGSNWIHCANGTYKVFLAKYSSSTSLQWVNGFGGNYGQTANSLAIDNNGGIYQGGYFNSDSMDIDPGPGTYYIHNYPNGVQDIYVAKFNSNNGNLNWGFTVGGYYSEVAQDLVLDNSGHFFITGNYGDTVDFDPGTGVHNLYGQLGSDGYLAEYDTAGHFIDAIPFNGTNGSYQFGLGACIIPPNKVGVTGFFSATSIDFDPGAGIHNLSVNGGNPTWSDAFVATYAYNSVGINGSLSEDNLFSTYPNPVSSELTIQCRSKIEEIKIYDVVGKEVYSSALPIVSTGIQATGFKNGVYFIQVKTGSRIGMKKIMVQH